MPESISFKEMQLRLLNRVNWRVDNGEFTERGLARILGISQPQMHNVRKGARTLTVALADRIMSRLGMTMLDLLEDSEVLECSALRTANMQAKAPARKPPDREREDLRAEWRTKKS